MSGSRKIYPVAVTLTLLMLILFGCGSRIPETIEIQVSKDVISLIAGQSETIQVKAVTSNSKIVPFETQTEGDCISVTSTEASVTVIAGTELCEQAIMIRSGSAEPKTIHVKVVADETVEIHVSKNITSLRVQQDGKPGQSETIEVRALTNKGKPVDFEFKTNGDCISVSSLGNSLVVSAGTELCEQAITIKAGSAKEKTIQVIVYDPMVMDIGEGLLIRYTNTYKHQWNAIGSGGKFDVTFWHPEADTQNGWYPLGSLIVDHYRDINKKILDGGAYPAVLVKDSKAAGLLAAPTDYELVYTDRRSGAKLYGSVWKAVCPENFVSFGVVTNGARTDAGWQKPSFEAIRCVRAGYTAQAAIGDRIYMDEWTGAKNYLSVWDIVYPPDAISTDNRAALLTGASLGCGPNPSTQADKWAQDVCDDRLVNMLLVPLPVYNSSENTMQPRLTGYEPLKISPRYFSSIRVPFTLIPIEYKDAPPARRKTNIEKSPFYYLQREEIYSPINIVNNTQNPNPAQYSYTISTGYSETESKSFTGEVGVEVTGKGGCKFFGTGGGWEVEVSTKFGWEHSVARTYSQVTTRDFTFTVPAGTYAEILQVTSQFRAIPMNPAIVPHSKPFDMNSSIITYLQYPPPLSPADD